MMDARRTTMNIDHKLVAEAQEILGTATATATVHASLAEVVRRFRVSQLADWDLDGMTLDDAAELRRPRAETRSWGQAPRADHNAS